MNRFIVADPAKCIGCRTCEVACVVAHQERQSCAAVSSEIFVPRIRVVKSAEVSSAVACYQCEDAPCAGVCPTGAIQRARGIVAVEQPLCIGCKSCMLACPFGVMQVAIQRRRAQAIKCDLCEQRDGGPACVAACPTHALACVDVERLRASRLAAER